MKKTILLLLTLSMTSVMFAFTDSTAFPTDTTLFPTDTTTWNPTDTTTFPTDTTTWNPTDTTTWNPTDTTSFPTDTTTWNPTDTTSFPTDTTNWNPSDTTTWNPTDTSSYIYLDSLINTAKMVYGCTDINAQNFDSYANKNNGSCIYVGTPTVAYGCTDASALNYNAKATINEGCIYEQKSVISLPKEIINKIIAAPEVKAIVETASTCDVDYTKLIDSVSISKIELMSNTTYRLFWNVYQGNNSTSFSQLIMLDELKSYIISTKISCLPIATLRTLSTMPTIEIASVLRTDVLTAAANAEELNTFSVFPNPASDEIMIEGNLTNKSVKVISMNGSVVKEVTTTRVDLSNLASGVYFIQCEINNNIVVKKVIKN